MNNCLNCGGQTKHLGMTRDKSKEYFSCGNCKQKYLKMNNLGAELYRKVKGVPGNLLTIEVIEELEKQDKK